MLLRAAICFFLLLYPIAAEECGAGICSVVCCSGFYGYDSACNEPFNTCATGIERMASCGATTDDVDGCANQGADNPCCKLKVWAVALVVVLNLLCWVGICYGVYRCCCAPAAANNPPATVIMSASQMPPTAGWSTSTDPKSGKPYYINAQTGETRWDLPTVPPPPPPPSSSRAVVV